MLNARVIIFAAVAAMAGCAAKTPIEEELAYVHSRFEYVSDLAQYGVRDKWVASYRGDCEDFALVLRDRLAARGIGSTVVLVVTRTGAPHAVLEAGGMILDNNSERPRKIEKTGYFVWRRLEGDEWQHQGSHH